MPYNGYTLTMHIRLAQERDCEQISELYLQAFPADEGPVVAELALALLKGQSQPASLALVAEDGSALIGHIAFSPVSLAALPACRAFILAPLAVQPDYQKKQIGSALVQAGIAQLRQAGLDLLFVYGDPGYYGRFGFKPEPARLYLPPYPLTYPFGWQVLHLHGFPPADTPQTLGFVTVLDRPELW